MPRSKNDVQKHTHSTQPYLIFTYGSSMAILLLLLMDNKTQYNTVFGVRNMMHGQTQTNFIVVRGAGYYLELIYGPQRVVNRQQMIRGQ